MAKIRKVHRQKVKKLHSRFFFFLMFLCEFNIPFHVNVEIIEGFPIKQLLFTIKIFPKEKNSVSAQALSVWDNQNLVYNLHFYVNETAL